MSTTTLPSFAQAGTRQYVHRRVALASGPEWRYVHVASEWGPDQAEHIRLARDLVAQGWMDECVSWGYQDDGRPVIVDRQFRPGSGQVEITRAGA